MEKEMKRFIEHINEKILPRIDYEQLENSYSTAEKAYAKGVLNLLHQAMVEHYGSAVLQSDHSSIEGDFVLVPGVIQGTKSGKIALALLEIDLQSSGEHWGTDFLCRFGVISQGNPDTPKAVKDIISRDFMPYDYCYTAQIPDDIHISRGSLPDGIKDMLDSFQNYSADLLPEEQAENEDKGEER